MPMMPAHHTALVVVDMQLGLDDPQYGFRNNSLCEANIIQLLDAARNRPSLVLFTRHVSSRAGSPLGPSLPTAAIKPALSPWAGEQVFDKTTNSAFKNPLFAAVLEQFAPTLLVFVGMATDACITACAREARDLGYAVMVIADACATFSRAGLDGQLHTAQAVHDVALASLAASSILICTTAQLLDCLTQQVSQRHT